MWPNLDLVTLTEEILNGNVHFLWSSIIYSFQIREIIELRTPILRSKFFFISYTQRFPVKKQKLSVQKSLALIKFDY